MKKAGELLAMLIRRWTSKTPKGAKVTSTVLGIIGAGALVTLAIPTGLPVWATVGIALVAATSSAYEKLKTTDEKTTVLQDYNKIYPAKSKRK
jgi:hypothetical protein